jgi:hypothetical protein
VDASAKRLYPRVRRPRPLHRSGYPPRRYDWHRWISEPSISCSRDRKTRAWPNTRKECGERRHPVARFFGSMAHDPHAEREKVTDPPGSNRRPAADYESAGKPSTAYCGVLWPRKVRVCRPVLSTVSMGIHRLGRQRGCQLHEASLSLRAFRCEEGDLNPSQPSGRQTHELSGTSSSSSTSAAPSAPWRSGRKRHE